jgi:predicted DNA-binding protein with PD1-like motif
MTYSEAKQGRVFVIRLENGEVFHEELERFAKEQDIKAASLIILGGAESGSMLTVGPEENSPTDIAPMTHVLQNVHEVCGVGTIFPDEEGNPIFHCHIACGRRTSAVVGCARTGINTWLVMEVILYELLDSTAIRKLEPDSGFHLLRP